MTDDDLKHLFDLPVVIDLEVMHVLTGNLGVEIKNEWGGQWPSGDFKLLPSRPATDDVQR